ncbi:1-phosphofructokinase family hexose kinase [Nocardia sp. CDC153]|uniref:1-phosphofructokinase family hexose kinase n=1 Tax=Nocardia sp. CDC153 TaxID=3112167 RepID=UPI002DB70277|nr:1-phosphofructokinase family hexose kinase [Nocardia sp. CDC153]MEC3957915.1 1-phosphofructokinase family hexose kinase [Nocardia sp. CDC153]
MSIVTLTMNPAIDIAATAEHIRPTDKIRCAAPRFDPGGGGINVARTVGALGEPVTAVIPAGGPSGALLEQLVADADVPARPVRVAGATRESLAVTDTGTGEQFRFVFPGPRLTAPEVHRCLAELERAAVGARLVVASGSLPPGVPDDFYQTVSDLLADRNIGFVLDASGAPLRAMRRGVRVLKPSVRELGEYVGHPLADSETRLAAVREVISAGVAEAVVLSLGGEGALVATAEGAEWFAPVEVAVRSGIGAGDAMVGGICVGLVRGYVLGDAVRLGLASAAAALETPGTRPGRPARIMERFETVARARA